MPTKPYARWVGAAVCALLAWAAAQAQPARLVHPRSESGSDLFIGYYWGLLDEALRRTEARYGRVEVVETPQLMNHKRAMEELAHDRIDIYVRAYIPPSYADKLSLVPFPLDKGLLGHRLMLTHQDTLTRLRRVRTAQDLAAFSIAQGAWWIDADILEAAGLQVVRSTSYLGMFDMVANKNVDLLPRGANEILGEYRNHSKRLPGLVMDDSMALVFPMSFYFIVANNPKGHQIRKRVLEGLESMVADGSFERRYQALKRKSLKGITLSGRTVVRLPNPFYDKEEYRVGQRDMWDQDVFR